MGECVRVWLPVRHTLCCVLGAARRPKEEEEARTIALRCAYPSALEKRRRRGDVQSFLFIN